jgi:dienelactone hydrolase
LALPNPYNPYNGSIVNTIEINVIQFIPLQFCIMDLLDQESQSNRGKKMVELQDLHQEDTIAALSYLKQLSYVDTNRIAITGSSFGGIQTILASEKQLGLRAAIAFAPAAMAWSKLPELRSRLLEAVRSATIPILLVQAENDYDLVLLPRCLLPSKPPTSYSPLSLDFSD